MRFLVLDVLLQKVYETHEQNSHTFCHCITYGWKYSEKINYSPFSLFSEDPLEPSQGPLRGPGPHFENQCAM